ncbi:hypothetical protein A1O3_10047 [Capronia epimyces CBS 606.96]|uniref:Uncharacterized protein n=1 Tax=Capronia epimyces CBS 606.96 TaxID=1182542 RepID=W9XHT2_9EURO|nr:uncharacterized protein A1O3_10047 [Capronia epimyces CBS 606.96]EXJ76890.1 hypothetical protein A1O3_10047 [Capronia epimyces CBS 606.96]
MPILAGNKKPLNFIPRLLQTVRSDRLFARQRQRQKQFTAATEVKVTSTSPLAGVQEDDTTPDWNLPRRQESSHSTTTPSINGLSREDFEIHRLSLALGAAFEIPTNSPTSDEFDLSAAEELTRNDATPRWIPAGPRSAGPGWPLFDAARLALQDFCDAPNDSTPGDDRADMAPTASLRHEGVGRNYRLNSGEELRRTHQRGSRTVGDSGEITSDMRDMVINTSEQHVSFAENTVIDHSQRRLPLSRPPTPPVYPQYVGSVHQTPGHWDSIGAKAALQHWIADFVIFRDELKEGLLVYFNKWTDLALFRGARKLLRALLQTPKVLKVLLGNIDVLPYSGSLAIEQLDMDLRVCMEESREVYHCMTRQNDSAAGPLQGKGLAWRKHMIKHDLGPRMERIADNLRILEQHANKTNREVRKAANEAIGRMESGRGIIPAL